MKRAVSLVAVAAAAAIFVPAIASAEEIQVGATTSPLIDPVCPSNVAQNECTIVLTQVTAYETLRDGVSDPTLITQPGVISSFSVGLSAISSDAATAQSDIAYLDKTYGGNPEVQLTVLRPTGTASSPSYRVAAQSPVFQVQGYLGASPVPEFPLVNALPVVKGELLALTVPTWAPVLSFDLTSTQFSYSQSRTQVTTSASGSNTTSCDTSSAANLAQVSLGEQSNYTCNYPGTRVEYTALEITTPAAGTSAAHQGAKRSHKKRAKHSAKRR